MDKILKIASSQGSMGKNDGCELAPNEILKYVKNNFSIDEVDVDNMNIERTNKNIFEKAKNFNGVILGGDHSITYAAFIAMASKNKNSGFVMMDAHVDCASYIKPPSHEDFLRVMIEDKMVKKKNVLLIGVRKIYDVERKYLKKKCIIATGLKMKDYKRKLKDFEELDSVYLSVDIDVFDPKIAMGTGYKVSNGMRKNLAFSMFKTIKQMKNLKVVDIVEVNPKLDKDNNTAMLAAEIADFFFDSKE